MNKVVFSLLTFALFVNMAFAQNATIEFSEETHDFGEVEELGGPVEHKFVFKNTGKIPLKIQDVKPSCGCTTPSWTKEPVLPGKEGFILAKYDPANRPGAFTKSLTITSNAEPSVTRLYIKGMVKPKAKSAQDEYPVYIGNLRMRYKSMHMGDVNTKEPVTKKFEIYNDSDQPMVFLDKVDAPEHIKISFEPKEIKPKSEGKLVVTYDGGQKKDYGTVLDNFTIYTNESTDNAKDLRVQASIKEYFPPMTAEQLAKAPKLNIQNSTYDFGSIKSGEKINAEFILTNEGRSNLNIRATKTTCGCTVAELPKDDLKPGESVTLKVIFDSTNRRGIQQKSINIYSNDPQRPAQRIILKGRVES